METYGRGPTSRATNSASEQAEARAFSPFAGTLRTMLACPLAGLMLACGGSEKVEKPTPPDMSAIVAPFESPTGTFGPDAAKQFVSAFSKSLRLMNRLGIDEQFLGPLRSSLQSDGELGGESTQALNVGRRQATLTLQAHGFLQVSRICNGWLDTPQPNRDENGLLHLTAGFTQEGLDPVMWGTGQRCRFRSGQSQVEVGSEIAPALVELFIGHNITIDGFGNGPVVLRLAGPLSIDGNTDSVDLSVEYHLQNKEFGLPIQVADGVVIAASSATELRQVRAANGVFRCGQVKGVCTSEQGATVMLDFTDQGGAQ